MVGPMRFVPIVLLVTLLSASGCAKHDPASAPAPSADTTAILIPATASQLRALAAKPGARATLLNVWASWCGPCREEFPALLAVAHRHPDVRLVLVSADFPEQRAEAEKFLASHGVRDTTYLKSGADQEFIDGLDQAWTGALPATLVFDASGRIVDFWQGAADSTRFEAALTRVLSPSHATH